MSRSSKRPGDRDGVVAPTPSPSATPGRSSSSYRQYAGVPSEPVQRQTTDRDPYAQRGAVRPDAWLSPMAGLDAGASVQRQAVTDAIDAPREVAEDRATIDGASGGLSPRQLAKAQQRNPHWAAKLGFSPSDFGSSAPVESAAFANDVARFQTEHGLPADGIAGPKTHQALGANQLEPGVLGADDELEDGVLGAENDQLEDGLIGTDDAMFTGAPAAAGGRGDQLESGLIDEAVQGAGMDASENADYVHAAAAHGIQAPAQELPYREDIEASTGQNLRNVKAHIGGAGAEASAAMGAEAYATGDHVVFASQPDKHTAAHEAQHVIQQRGGVQLKGGVGQAGDAYEQEADEVADRVVRGELAESLPAPDAGANARAVQRKDGPVGESLENAPSTGERRPGQLAAFADDACEVNPESPGCFLSERDRGKLQTSLSHRLTNLREVYSNAILEQRVKEKLEPDPGFLGLVLDVIFMVAPLGTGALIKSSSKLVREIGPTLARDPIRKAWLGVPGRQETVFDFKRVASMAETVMGSLLSQAKEKSKAGVASVTGDSELKQWLAQVDGDMRVRVDEIQEAAMSMDDLGLAAVVAWADPQMHRPERYIAEVTKLVETFASEVQSVGSRIGITHRVAAEITGPMGHRRVALGSTIGSPNYRPMGKQFHFAQWATAGFDKMAQEKQKEEEGEFKMAYDDDGLIDPTGEVAEWVANLNRSVGRGA